MKKILPLFLVVLLSGCAHFYPNYTFSMEGCADRISKSINRGLAHNYLGISVLVTAPVEATTLATGDFGLVMQELLIGAMRDAGANVVDAEVRRTPYITCEDGVVGISRDASRLKDEYRAGVILITSYVERDTDVLLTARAVDFVSNDVIAAVSTSLYKSPSVKALVRGSGRQIYER